MDVIRHLRLSKDIYDVFRELCKEEGRTMGKMLEALVKNYLKTQEGKKNEQE